MHAGGHVERAGVAGNDVPPAFGTWAIVSHLSSVGYIGFWPNCMYRAGTVANIAVWCKIRSEVARQEIGNQN